MKEEDESISDPRGRLDCLGEKKNCCVDKRSSEVIAWRKDRDVCEWNVSEQKQQIGTARKPGGRRDVLNGCQDLKRPPQSCFWVRTAEDTDETLCGLVMFLLELSLIVDICLETSTLKSFYYSSLVCRYTSTFSPSISWTLCLYITDCLHFYAVLNKIITAWFLFTDVTRARV